MGNFSGRAAGTHSTADWTLSEGAGPDTGSPESDPIDPPSHRQRGLPRHTKKILLGVAFLVAVAVGQYLRAHGILDGRAALAWIQLYPIAAPVLFILMFAIFVPLMLPTLPVNIAAGFIWGPLWGGAFSSLGGTLGAIAAFAITRFVLGQPLGRRFGVRLADWLQQRISQHGWKVVAFVRMNPIFPGPVNFVLGLTSIRFRTYCWATAVFQMPPTFFFAYTGGTLGQVVLGDEIPNIALNVIVLSLGVTGFAVVVMLMSMWMKWNVGENPDLP